MASPAGQREAKVAGAKLAIRGVSARALSAGLGIAALHNFWSLHSLYIIRGSWLNRTHFPMGVFVTFLILVLATPVLRRFVPRLALSGPELLVALCAGLAGGMVPTFGLSTTWIGMLAIPHYLATPENQWGEYLLPHVPGWMVPSNAQGAMRWLFEGLPPGEGIPWGEWAVPLFWWTALLGGMALVSFCTVAVLHRQWSGHERLAYPIPSVAADMAEGAAGRGEWAGLLRNRMFIAGLSVALAIKVWNLVPAFVHGFPMIRLFHQQLWVYFTQYSMVHVSLNFYTIGFAYMTGLDLLLSIWLFHLFYILEIAAFARIGLGVAGFSGGDVSWQGGGAMMCYVGLALWTARGHLGRVVRRALGRADGAEDAGELMRYRWAVWGLVLGVVFVICWLRMAGMGLLLSTALTVLLFLSYLGLTRIVAQTGLLYVNLPQSAQGLILGTAGAASIPAPGLTAMAFTNVFANDHMGLFMPAFAQIAKLAERVERHRRRLGWVVGLGLLTSIATSVALTLYWGYSGGAYNFGSIALFRRTVPSVNGYVSHMRSPDPVHAASFILFAAGAAGMALLAFLRYRFNWWPVHPAGLAVGYTGMTRHAAFSIFAAWVCKFIVIKTGGMLLYRRTVPFFIGTIVGYALAVPLGYVLDVIFFPGQGHGVHAY